MHFLPEFKGPIEGYVVNHLKRSLWRIAATHTREEALQEAYIVFMRCAAKYPLIETPQHFMSIFKRTWENEFNDLSTKATKVRRMVPESGVSEEGEEVTFDTVGDLDNDGMLAVMIRQAPFEVMLVMNLFLTAPQELLDLALSTWRANGGQRAEGDKAVAKMLGLPADSKPMEQTRNYFTH